MGGEDDLKDTYPVDEMGWLKNIPLESPQSSLT